MRKSTSESKQLVVFIGGKEELIIFTDIIGQGDQSYFTLQIYWEKKNLLFKTMECHKERPDKIIGQFTTSNETVSKRYFDQSWRTRVAGHPERENMAYFWI